MERVDLLGLGDGDLITNQQVRGGGVHDVRSLADDKAFSATAATPAKG